MVAGTFNPLTAGYSGSGPKLHCPGTGCVGGAAGGVSYFAGLSATVTSGDGPAGMYRGPTIRGTVSS